MMYLRRNSYNIYLLSGCSRGYKEDRYNGLCSLLVLRGESAWGRAVHNGQPLKSLPDLWQALDQTFHTEWIKGMVH